MPPTDAGAVLHLRPEYERGYRLMLVVRRQRRQRLGHVPAGAGRLPRPRGRAGQARQGRLPAARRTARCRRRGWPTWTARATAGHCRRSSRPGSATWSSSPRCTPATARRQGRRREVLDAHPPDARRPRPAPARRSQPHRGRRREPCRCLTSSGAASRSAGSASASRSPPARRTGRPQDAPGRLDTFRFTTGSRYIADAIAELYGGRSATWDTRPVRGHHHRVRDQFVTVPPRDQVISQWYEMWTAGGLPSAAATRSASRSAAARACARTPKTPTNDDEVANAAAQRARLAKLNPPQACKLVTRINVMIPDLPGLGVFRLDTHSFYAAVEIGDEAALMQPAREHGVFLRGHAADRAAAAGRRRADQEVPGARAGGPGHVPRPGVRRDRGPQHRRPAAARRRARRRLTAGPSDHGTAAGRAGRINVPPRTSLTVRPGRRRGPTSRPSPTRPTGWAWRRDGLHRRRRRLRAIAEFLRSRVPRSGRRPAGQGTLPTRPPCAGRAAGLFDQTRAASTRTTRHRMAEPLT